MQLFSEPSLVPPGPVKKKRTKTVTETKKEKNLKHLPQSSLRMCAYTPICMHTFYAYINSKNEKLLSIHMHIDMHMLSCTVRE